MTDEKVLFIIPGYGHRPTKKPYRTIASFARGAGYTPIIVPLSWKNKTVSENTALFLAHYRRIPAKKKYILGFSFGAMVAFIAATKEASDGLILCSLSPYFREDLPRLDTTQSSQIYLKRLKDYATLHSGSLARRVKAENVLLMYGSQEHQWLIHRVTDAFGNLSTPRKRLIPIHDTKHDIGSRRYLYNIHLATQAFVSASNLTNAPIH